MHGPSRRIAAHGLRACTGGWLAAVPAAAAPSTSMWWAGATLVLAVLLGATGAALGYVWHRARRLEAAHRVQRVHRSRAERAGGDAGEANRRLAVILESITDAFCAFDRDWRFIYLNGEAESLFGRPRRDLLGRVLWEAYPYLSGTAIERRLREAMSGREPAHFEGQSPRTERWYEVHAYPNEEGGLGVYWRDITQRHLAEEALRASESRFRAIADTAPVLIWTADADGRATFLNRAWTEFTGRPLEEELERWDLGVHPEDRQRRIDAHRAAAAAGAPFTHQFRLRRHDGVYRWFYETGTTRRTPGGAFVGLVGSAVDVTDLIEAEAARRGAERQFRETLENLQLIAVMLDADGSIIFCNDYLVRLSGWAREELLGHNWFEVFVHGPERPAAEGLLRRAVLAGDVPAYYENTIVTRSGDRRLIAWNNTILRDPSGRPAGLTSLGVDITRQRWAEEQIIQHKTRLEQLVAERTAALEASHEQLRLSERMASIGTLAAGLGHDMNNLLLPIRIRLEALESQAMGPAVREAVESVRQSVEYLQQLTNSLRALAMDAGGAAGPEWTDLHRWWAQTRPMLRAAIRREVELEEAIPAGLPPVRVGPAGLTQAVLNLLTNAADAIHGRGHVRLWAELAPDGASVRLGVTDTGSGMPPEVAWRALEPFFTTKPRGVGTGLGLALVQGVVQRVGGRVEIQSEPGRGTTVTLTLPAASVVGPCPSPAALVSLSDPRLATFVATYLSTQGFVTRCEVQADPDGAAIWVTEASAGSLEAARRFLDRDPTRRVVVVGPAGPEWALIGATVVDTVQRPGALRVALGHAASLWRETDRDRSAHPSPVRG